MGRWTKISSTASQAVRQMRRERKSCGRAGSEENNNKEEEVKIYLRESRSTLNADS